ncbi:MAG: MATE family efflux transporter, partial [Sphaerochaetaceae bacterium]
PLAVTVFGLYIKVESFVFLPMHGMGFSLVPITSYNYGSENRERILSALKWSLIYTYLFMALGFLIFQTKPQLLIALFSPSEALRSLSDHAFRRISLCFIGAPVIYLTAGFLQGFGKGFQAMLITLLRQVLGVLPAAYLLARTMGLDGVWYCYFCGDIVGVSVSLFLFHRLYKTTIKKMITNQKSIKKPLQSLTLCNDQ